MNDKDDMPLFALVMAALCIVVAMMLCACGDTTPQQRLLIKHSCDSKLQGPYFYGGRAGWTQGWSFGDGTIAFFPEGMQGSRHQFYVRARCDDLRVNP